MKKALAPVLALVAIAATGCGTAVSGSTSLDAAALTRKPAVLNGEQAKTARQVLADAKAALAKATYVHLRTSGGTDDQLDLRFAGADTAGTITHSGVTVNLVIVGTTVYLNGPKAYWAQSGAGAAASRLANKWLVSPKGSAKEAESLTLANFASSLNADDSPLEPAVRTTTLDGKPVVVLTQKDGSTIDIAATGAPVPMKLTDAGTDAVVVTFTEYGEPQVITAPSGAVTPQEAARSLGTF